MHLSKMEFIALVIAIVLGLHFYNQHKMENELYDDSDFETPLYLKEDRPPVIVAFGDSLTAGVGVAKEFSYPAQLSDLLGIDVINAGKPGETTSKAVVRMRIVLNRYKPDIVILAEGANDLLHGRKRAVIKKNLKTMVEMIKKSGAKAVILGMPDMDLIELMISSDIDLYEEVANETGAYYIPEIFGKVLKNGELKSDNVHPNVKGYRIIAENIYEGLRELIL